MIDELFTNFRVVSARNCLICFVNNEGTITQFKFYVYRILVCIGKCALFIMRVREIFVRMYIIA